MNGGHNSFRVSARSDVLVLPLPCHLHAMYISIRACQSLRSLLKRKDFITAD